MKRAKSPARFAMRAQIIGLLCLALAGPACAEPKGPNGEKCDSSETNVKHVINGVQYSCDKCVFTQCDSSGGAIKNCKQVTHWSNCVAVSGTSGASGTNRVNGVNTMAPPKPNPSPAPPKANLPNGNNKAP